jgi:hypothetical protein
VEVLGGREVVLRHVGYVAGLRLGVVVDRRSGGRLIDLRRRFLVGFCRSSISDVHRRFPVDRNT